MDIILAFDGSDESELALRLVAEMPIPLGSELHVVTVVDTVNFNEALINRPTADWANDYHQVVAEEARVKQEKIAPYLSHKPYPVHWHIKKGQAADVLIKMAGELEADVIVAGSRGLSGLKKYFLGSVSHKLLKHAPCSVLIGRNPRGELPKLGKLKFLVAYDGSETARHLVAELRQLNLAAIAELSFLYVVEPLLTVNPHSDIGAYMSELQEERERILDRLAAYKREFAMEAPELVVEVECREKHRGIGQEIIESAIRRDSDVIFLGSSGKGKLDHILLGSVSQRVAEYSHHAVWLYRSKD